MRNPFRYGEVVRGDRFGGRERERQELMADILNGQNVVVISPRRFGKTSLVLEVLADIADSVPSAYVDLLRVPSVEHLPSALATEFARLLSPGDRMIDRVRRLFDDLALRPKFGVDEAGRPTVEFEPGASAADIGLTLDGLFQLPGRIAERRKTRVAVVFDEFQSVVDLDTGLPARMRAIFQLQADVAHVFLGSRRHVIERLFTGENEPMFRMAKVFPLGPIPADEFGPFIHGRFVSTKSPISAEAVERILSITGGHPHDTQELCYFTWAETSANGIYPIPPTAVDRALDRVLDAENARYGALWDRLAVSQRSLLVALSRESDAGVYEAKFRRRHRLGEPTSVARAAGRLVDLEVIAPVPGPGAVYRIVDTFLPAWLRRLMAPMGDR